MKKKTAEPTSGKGSVLNKFHQIFIRLRYSDKKRGKYEYDCLSQDKCFCVNVNNIINNLFPLIF